MLSVSFMIARLLTLRTAQFDAKAIISLGRNLAQAADAGDNRIPQARGIKTSVFRFSGFVRRGSLFRYYSKHGASLSSSPLAGSHCEKMAS
jgi:hypothetical protein